MRSMQGITPAEYDSTKVYKMRELRREGKVKLVLVPTAVQPPHGAGRLLHLVSAAGRAYAAAQGGGFDVQCYLGAIDRVRAACGQR